jgi:hypothetical protein
VIACGHQDRKFSVDHSCYLPRGHAGDHVLTEGPRLPYVGDWIRNLLGDRLTDPVSEGLSGLIKRIRERWRSGFPDRQFSREEAERVVDELLADLDDPLRADLLTAVYQWSILGSLSFRFCPCCDCDVGLSIRGEHRPSCELAACLVLTECLPLLVGVHVAGTCRCGRPLRFEDAACGARGDRCRTCRHTCVTCRTLVADDLGLCRVTLQVDGNYQEIAACEACRRALSIHYGLGVWPGPTGAEWIAGRFDAFRERVEDLAVRRTPSVRAVFDRSQARCTASLEHQLGTTVVTLGDFEPVSAVDEQLLSWLEEMQRLSFERWPG